MNQVFFPYSYHLFFVLGAGSLLSVNLYLGYMKNLSRWYCLVDPWISRALDDLQSDYPLLLTVNLSSLTGKETRHLSFKVLHFFYFVMYIVIR